MNLLAAYSTKNWDFMFKKIVIIEYDFFGTYLHGRNVLLIGEKRFLAPVKALFSLTFRPPLSVVFRAPAFHGSGVITLSSFFSHFSQTISRRWRWNNIFVFPMKFVYLQTIYNDENDQGKSKKLSSWLTLSDEERERARTKLSCWDEPNSEIFGKRPDINVNVTRTPDQILYIQHNTFDS